MHKTKLASSSKAETNSKKLKMRNTDVNGPSETITGIHLHLLFSVNIAPC